MDPNPYKSPGLWFARIAAELDMSLRESGYSFAGSNHLERRLLVSRDYRHRTNLLSISWDRRDGTLLAEFLGENGQNLVEIVRTTVSGSLSQTDQEERLILVAEAVRRFLASDAAQGG